MNGVYGVCKYRFAPKKGKLLGECATHSLATASRNNNDSYSLFSHISFFPKPSVLSVNFINEGSMAHIVKGATAA